jgi:DNA polymerase delta subunit 2
MLEDESGRLRLIGSPLTGEMLVTGCIVAVMGTENANGDFEVVDIKVPDLPSQPERWHAADLSTTNGARKKVKLDDEDEDMDKPVASHGKKIAIVSGLGFSATNSEHSLEINLLTEFLLGEALDPGTQESVSQISRLIIAGNSITLDTEAVSHDTIGNAKKVASKKYGYDSSAYNPTPTTHFDNFLASLLPTIPITLIPGCADPANVSLPQQPIHSAMFPQARAYGAMPPVADENRQPGWFDAVTNPWDGEVEGWRVLGTGGQNVDDVFKYVESEDRLGMMEAMCRWRCCAPTAPDTLCKLKLFVLGTLILLIESGSYPFQDDDPFVLNSCPHLFFVGSQPKFDTASIEGPRGQTVRLIAVPRFSETGEIVLVDSETLEASVVKFAVS